MDIEKKAIEEFNFFNEGDYITREMAEAKDVVLKELEKKDKIIDEMAKQLLGLLIFDDKDDLEAILETKEKVKEYFIKKVADINVGDMPEQK